VIRVSAWINGPIVTTTHSAVLGLPQATAAERLARSVSEMDAALNADEITPAEVAFHSGRMRGQNHGRHAPASTRSTPRARSSPSTRPVDRTRNGQLEAHGGNGTMGVPRPADPGRSGRITWQHAGRTSPINAPTPRRATRRRAPEANLRIRIPFRLR